ncbi:L-serine ammonia-lyase, iron-sulfur-dependent subunit beta [Ruminococcaceae bacterium OttesenSCG-928-I18]|nr:L-serine ammonia-lyase, iron-sulfur-dependent subunit beta [Ruminococcaceae bacterium OttesenSCG-928-I18]
MELSIFEVLGPVMIGPSSSHTAGAARLARVAAIIAGKEFDRVYFGLSGSFAKTGRAHGTYQALLAGALGFHTDDERLRNAYAEAEKRGVVFDFQEEDLEEVHENAVHICFFHANGEKSNILGASVGGGRISIRRIGELETEITATNPTMVVYYQDRPGCISEVSRVLAEKEINIAVMRVSRTSKGGYATAVIETDESFPADVVKAVRQVNEVTEVIIVDVPEF